MVVHGVFSSAPAPPSDQDEGWEDVSEVLDRPTATDASSDRITSEFPESIEEAVRIAAETHARSPLAPELPPEAEPHRRSSPTG